MKQASVCVLLLSLMGLGMAISAEVQIAFSPETLPLCLYYYARVLVTWPETLDVSMGAPDLVWANFYRSDTLSATGPDSDVISRVSVTTSPGSVSSIIYETSYLDKDTKYTVSVCGYKIQGDFTEALIHCQGKLEFVFENDAAKCSKAHPFMPSAIPLKLVIPIPIAAAKTAAKSASATALVSGIAMTALGFGLASTGVGLLAAAGLGGYASSYFASTKQEDNYLLIVDEILLERAHLQLSINSVIRAHDTDAGSFSLTAKTKPLVVLGSQESSGLRLFASLQGAAPYIGDKPAVCLVEVVVPPEEVVIQFGGRIESDGRLSLSAEFFPGTAWDHVTVKLPTDCAPLTLIQSVTTLASNWKAAEKKLIDFIKGLIKDNTEQFLRSFWTKIATHPCAQEKLFSPIQFGSPASYIELDLTYDKFLPDSQFKLDIISPVVEQFFEDSTAENATFNPASIFVDMSVGGSEIAQASYNPTFTLTTYLSTETASNVIRGFQTEASSQSMKALTERLSSVITGITAPNPAFSAQAVVRDRSNTFWSFNDNAPSKISRLTLGWFGSSGVSPANAHVVGVMPAADAQLECWQYTKESAFTAAKNDLTANAEMQEVEHMLSSMKTSLTDRQAQHQVLAEKHATARSEADSSSLLSVQEHSQRKETARKRAESQTTVNTDFSWTMKFLEGIPIPLGARIPPVGDTLWIRQARLKALDLDFVLDKKNPLAPATVSVQTGNNLHLGGSRRFLPFLPRTQPPSLLLELDLQDHADLTRPRDKVFVQRLTLQLKPSVELITVSTFPKDETHSSVTFSSRVPDFLDKIDIHWDWKLQHEGEQSALDAFKTLVKQPLNLLAKGAVSAIIPPVILGIKGMVRNAIRHVVTSMWSHALRHPCVQMSYVLPSEPSQPAGIHVMAHDKKMVFMGAFNHYFANTLKTVVPESIRGEGFSIQLTHPEAHTMRIILEPSASTTPLAFEQLLNALPTLISAVSSSPAVQGASTFVGAATQYFTSTIPPLDVREGENTVPIHSDFFYLQRQCKVDAVSTACAALDRQISSPLSTPLLRQQQAACRATLELERTRLKMLEAVQAMKGEASTHTKMAHAASQREAQFAEEFARNIAAESTGTLSEKRNKFEKGVLSFKNGVKGIFSSKKSSSSKSASLSTENTDSVALQILYPAAKAEMLAELVAEEAGQLQALQAAVTGVEAELAKLKDDAFYRSLQTGSSLSD